MHFNGVDITKYAKILNIQRSILPPIENKSIEIPGREGSMFIKNRLKEREIFIKLELKGVNRRNVYSKARDLLALLYTDNPAELWFNDDPDYYYKAILSGDTNLSLIYLYGIIELKFICYDPYMYHRRGKEIRYSHNSGLEQIELYNNSDFIADTIFDFTALDFGKSNLSIRNLTNGTGINTSANINTMHMDSKRNLIIINGAIANDKLTFSSSYITLAPGLNTIEFNFRTQGTIKYIERRL